MKKSILVLIVIAGILAVLIIFNRIDVENKRVAEEKIRHQVDTNLFLRIPESGPVEVIDAAGNRLDSPKIEEAGDVIFLHGEKRHMAFNRQGERLLEALSIAEKQRYTDLRVVILSAGGEKQYAYWKNSALLPQRFDKAENFDESKRALVTIGGRVNIVDEQLSMLLPEKYEFCKRASYRYTIVRIGKLFGLYDVDNRKEAKPCRYTGWKISPSGTIHFDGYGEYAIVDL